MTAPKISDKVYNACWKVYSKNGDSLEKVLLEYDRLVCEPLRLEITMINQSRNSLWGERDAALAHLTRIKELVANQACEAEIWEPARTAFEAYLQLELRTLHLVIEEH